MNPSALDLNLFVVLRAVLEEGSVTGAAARLHVTQSAVSNALARLRATVGDPLFVRHGRGLVPTPRALALRDPVAAALDGLLAALDPGFDPLATERTFTLAAADHHQADAVPRLAAALATALPRACLRVVSVDYLVATDGLASGSVDAVIAPADTAGAGLLRAPLFAEAATIVVRRDHPTVGEVVTVAELNALRHVDTHLVMGAPGEVHRATAAFFARIGLHRQVALIVPSFTAALVAAAGTELVAWVPEHALRALAALPVRAVAAPFPPMRALSALVWHERTDADPACRAFRDVVVGALREPEGAAT